MVVIDGRQREREREKERVGDKGRKEEESDNVQCVLYLLLSDKQVLTSVMQQRYQQIGVKLCCAYIRLESVHMSLNLSLSYHLFDQPSIIL